ncbi:MAG TPA: NAD(P)-dependent oxidoreductase [Spirochaetes bacterium]|nr:NAD(P)-dependent oxidoreductase [Spirochaetota bacterium]
MVEQEEGHSRSLVTGATGFIGSNLVRGLLNKGWKVDVLVRPSSSLDMLADVQNSLSIHAFNGKTEQMLEILSKVFPDVVFHVASMVVGEHKPAQVEELISSNITFGNQLLEAMSISGVSKFVNIGTYWEHYENKQYSPVNLYAATKYAFQNILQYYVEAKDISANTLKLFDTYGPNDPRPKILNLLLNAVRTGEKLVMSPGKQKLDLVYIDDVVNAFLTAAERLLAGNVRGHEIYGVGTGEFVSLRNLVQVVEKIAGNSIHVEWGAKPYRPRDVMFPWDYKTQLSGWVAKVGLEEGIRRCWNINNAEG